MSKSVKLRMNAAMTGRKKNIPIERSAGARKNRAVLVFELSPMSHHPPSLLEHQINGVVKDTRCVIHAHSVHRDLLGSLPDFLGDLFPFGNFWGSNHMIQLFEERYRILIVCRRRVFPRFDAGGKISRELGELHLD